METLKSLHSNGHGINGCIFPIALVPVLWTDSLGLPTRALQNRLFLLSRLGPWPGQGWHGSQDTRFQCGFSLTQPCECSCCVFGDRNCDSGTAITSVLNEPTFAANEYHFFPFDSFITVSLLLTHRNGTRSFQGEYGENKSPRRRSTTR